ncbi:little elongation complex subunit 1 isoform X2 [Tiliqua scincoides]|uniref:little elongation complex subunit 1 isoform X2 n=1 Tax=Tiliqua scincoides TaxID=71010 RepID=UPI00346238AC
MMPGETPPAAATAGVAAEAAAACSNCGALQQNLNEYVAALIALKQKIIDTDHLLTDYQQKCDELQFAARESNTLRRQVEQMLQKLSPLEKCQEELDSVKAELEEKKSSLKIYQNIREEYDRVKEEKDKSEMIKKKLETKVKKLEEAAAKHIQDFKQLKAEKKVLEKELKKVQEKIEGFPNAEQKKILKHAETQSEREIPVTHLDKEKIKLLLEELWMCIDNSTEKSQINKNDYLLVNYHDYSRTHEKTKAMQKCQKLKKPQGEKLSHSSSEACTTQASLTSLQTKLNSKPTRRGDPVKNNTMEITENNTMEITEDYNCNSPSYKGGSPEVIQTNLAESSTDLFGKEQEELGENLQDILSWFKPLPPLLSPVQFSPASTPHTLFGNLTDSSDEEMDQDVQMLESILEKHVQHEPTAETPDKKHSAELPSKCNSSTVNDASSDSKKPPERWSELKNEVSVLHSDNLTATSGCVSKKEDDSKEETHLEDNSLETNTVAEIATHSSENLNENTVTMTKMKDKTLVPGASSFLVGQQDTAESMLLQEAVPFEHVLEQSSDLRKGKEELTVSVATTFILTDVDLSQTPDGGLEQQTEESILTTQNVLVVPKKLDDSSRDIIKVVVEGDGSKDIQTKSCLGNAELLDEEDPEHVTASEQSTVAEGACLGCSSESEVKMNSSNCKFVSETEHPNEHNQQQGNAVMLTQAIEKDFDASDISIKLLSAEENHSIKEDKCEPHEEKELMNIDSASQSSDAIVPAEKCKNSLACMAEIIQIGSECSIASSVSTKNLEDDQLETGNETAVDKLAEDISVETKSMDIKEECLQLEELIDQKDPIKLEQPDCDSDSMLLPQTLVIKDSLSLSEVPVQPNHVAFELETFTRSVSKLHQVKGADTEPEKVPSISNNVQSTEAAMGDECLTSKGFEEEDSESSKSPKLGSMESGESEKSSVSDTILDRDTQSCLIAENLQCNVPFQETANLTAKGNSFDATMCAVEGTEMSYECPVTKKMLSGKEGPAESIQDVLQAKNRESGTTLPAIVTVSCKSTTDFMEITTSHLEVSLEHLDKSGQISDVASTLSSVPVCIASSSPTREDADCAGHLNSEGDLKGQEANAPDSEENTSKSLVCCSSHQNNNTEVEIEQFKELSATNEPQALVDVKGCRVVDITERLTPQAPILNNFNTGHISVLSGEELLVSPSEKLASSSRNSAVEHTLGEASVKEAGEILSSDGTFGKGEELKTLEDVESIDSSASDSSEECYPLRKVNCTKQFSRFPVFKEEMGITSSQTSVPSSTTLSCGNVPQCSFVTEEVSPKDRQASIRDADIFAVEAITRTLDHTYAATRACCNENALLNLEASIAVEMNEERQEQQYISPVASLASEALACNRKSAPRKSSADNLEVNGDIVASSPEHNAAIVEISEVHSAFDKEKWSAKHGRTFTASGASSNKERDHLASDQADSSTNTSHNPECHIDSDEKAVAAKTSWNPISPDSKTSHTNSEQLKVMPERSEASTALASCTKSGAKQALKLSGFKKVSAKAGVKGDHSRLLQRVPSKKEKKKNRQVLLGETILANADTSTPTKHSSKSLTKIREEMGPPLPPLLPPLLATPPRTGWPTSPVMTSSSQSSLPSPLDELISPLRVTPVPPLMSPLTATPKRKSPATLTTQSPPDMAIGRRTLSSPLQFCATTPKHALPVPGRLPPSAAGTAVPPVPQENSVKILDSMYPELSPLARTLSILKGNIQLSRSSSLDGENIPRPVHPITGFKAIASKNTAFVKTGTNFKSDLEQPFSSMNKTGKRTLASVAVPKSAKKLRLDKSPKLDICKEDISARSSHADVSCPADETSCLSNGSATQSTGDCDTKLFLPAEETNHSDDKAVSEALEKMTQSCFDLLPVIRSHFFVNNTSKVPVMRDEEKDVVYEFGVAKKDLAEPLLKAVLTKLKTGKMSLGHNHIQSLCRVYIGICRQLGDREKARLFCYSLLKEGFPNPDKLFLFIGNVWSEIFSSESVINKAIQLVARQHAKGEVLKYLKTYLNWEESSPLDIGAMVSSLLLSMQVCPQMEFQQNEQYGEDLTESAWEYVFAIDLLCSHQKWHWTHDNIISKELWPIMDKWIKNRVGNGNSSSPSDIIVATVLRLIGRLGQIGLRGGFVSAVESISSVVGAFLQHAKEKDVPWGVQLAAAYALFDLGPSNPSGILEAIHVWEAVSTNSLPIAVTSGMAEVSSLLKYAERTA